MYGHRGEHLASHGGLAGNGAAKVQRRLRAPMPDGAAAEPLVAAPPPSDVPACGRPTSTQLHKAWRSRESCAGKKMSHDQST